MRSIQKWAKPFVLMMTLAFALGAVGCSSECEDACDAACDLSNDEVAGSCTDADRSACKTICDAAGI